MIKRTSNSKAIVLVMFITIFSSLISFAKEAVFAYYFGISSEVDAYVMGTQIPIILFAIVAVALKTVVIPIYSKKYYSRGEKEANYFYSNLITIVVLLTIVISIIGMIFASPLMYLFASGFDAKTHMLSVEIMRIVFLSIVFNAIININTGVLNVYKYFVLPKIFINVANIIFILFIYLFYEKIGILAATIGLILGMLVNMIFMQMATTKLVKYKPVMNFKDSDIVEALNRSIPVFFGIGAAQFNRIVDRIISSYLEIGYLSALNYASKLMGLFSSLFLTSISTVMYPEFSQLVSEKKLCVLKDKYELILKVYVLVSIPLILGVFVLKEKLVSVTLGRGAFDTRAINITSLLFAIYMVGILFSAIREITSKLFYSMGDTKTPMKNSLVGISLNIILNLILIKPFGAYGLAFATVISTGVIAILLLYDVNSKIFKLRNKELGVYFLKVLVASFIMALIIEYVKIQILSNNNVSSFLLLVVSGVVGILVYAFLLRILKIKEVDLITKLIREKIYKIKYFRSEK